MNKRYLAITTLLFGAMACAMTLRAQDLVQFPKGRAIWTIDVAQSPVPRAGPPTVGSPITKEEVSQDGQKRRIQATTSDGRTDVVWSIAATNAILMKAANGVVFGVPTGVAGGIVYDLPYSESAFSWIKPGMLVEKDPISYAGKSCFHYKGTAHWRVNGFSAPTPYTAEAWIDSKTLAPVALDNGVSLATYTYPPPPYPALTLPPEYQKTFDRLSR